MYLKLCERANLTLKCVPTPKNPFLNFTAIISGCKCLFFNYTTVSLKETE